MHDVFAWVRLVTLLHGPDAPNDPHLMEKYRYHGIRLFGEDRFREITTHASDTDHVDVAKRGAIAVLDTSGYYDDPRDRRRTLANMEECALYYIDRWRWDRPVWQRDPTDAHTDVGIEIPFDLVIDIEGLNLMSVRYVGRIDGIHHHVDGINLHDNKTASRLNDAWEMSFNISSQITGYCIAASVFTQQVVERAHVLGLAVPLPKLYDYGGYVQSGYLRQSYHYDRWLTWLVHTVQMYNLYTGDPYAAPRYSHSCNRYFRPCQFIPFCDATEEEERLMINEFVTDVWSPLDSVAAETLHQED
jgi:hypothetical protein